MIDQDGFETVHVTEAAPEKNYFELPVNNNGPETMYYKTDHPNGQLIPYIRSDIPRNTIQDALNLMALGDNTQARAVLEAYLKEGK